METVIHRSMPCLRQIKEYPRRVNMNEYLDFLKNEEFMKKYESLKKGINFKTNRKIKINSRTYNNLERELNANKFERYQYEIALEGDVDNYNRQTQILYEKIDKENEQSRCYNILVTDIQKEIANLEYWREYVEFEGKCYGIPIVFEHIHRENDCNGRMVLDRSELCSCNKCESWSWTGSYSDHVGTDYYKCKVCGFEYSINSDT